MFELTRNISLRAQCMSGVALKPVSLHQDAGVLSIFPTLSDFPTVAQNYSYIYRSILPHQKILLRVSASRLWLRKIIQCNFAVDSY